MQSQLLLTGGEGGLLSLWKPNPDSEADITTNFKVMCTKVYTSWSVLLTWEPVYEAWQITGPPFLCNNWQHQWGGTCWMTLLCNSAVHQILIRIQLILYWQLSAVVGAKLLGHMKLLLKYHRHVQNVTQKLFGEVECWFLCGLSDFKNWYSWG